MEIEEPGPDVKPQLVMTVCPVISVPQSSHPEPIISNQHEVTPLLVPFQCSECFANKQLTKVFSSQILLKYHVRDCHGPSQFKCEVCFKAFHKLSTLKMHRRSHSENKIKCDLCPQTLQTTYALQRHLFRAHNKKTEGSKYFKCEFCAREYVDKSKFERHVSSKHIVNKDFPCPVCSKTFIDSETLEKHVTGHDKHESFVCDLCSKEYQYRETLKKHLKSQHDKFFYCYKCCRSFSNQVEFDEHKLGSKLKTLQFKCEICLEIFTSQCNLDMHTNSHLKEIKITKPEEEPKIKSGPSKNIEDNVKTALPKSKSTQEELPQLHTCEICVQTFDRESHLKLHRFVVHPNAIWKCNFDQCSKSFKWYSMLKKHKVTHSKVRQ